VIAVEVPVKIALQFSSTFVKLRRATVNIVMPVCPPVTAVLQLDCHEILYLFSEIYRENSSFIKI
jgi:hypothetical protein